MGTPLEPGGGLGAERVERGGWGVRQGYEADGGGVGAWVGAGVRLLTRYCLLLPWQSFGYRWGLKIEEKWQGVGL